MRNFTLRTVLSFPIGLFQIGFGGIPGISKMELLTWGAAASPKSIWSNGHFSRALATIAPRESIGAIDARSRVIVAFSRYREALIHWAGAERNLSLAGELLAVSGDKGTTNLLDVNSHLLLETIAQGDAIILGVAKKATKEARPRGCSAST